MRPVTKIKTLFWPAVVKRLPTTALTNELTHFDDVWYQSGVNHIYESLKKLCIKASHMVNLHQFSAF